jgi:multiple sugar transport system permease protein
MMLRARTRPYAPPRNSLGSRLRYAFTRHAVGYLFLLPALVDFALFAWYPMLKSFQLSFVHYQNNNLTAPTHWVGLDNFHHLFTDPMMLPSIGQVWWNTVEFTLYALALGYIVPISLALAINEVRLGRSFFRVIFYVPVILPTLVTTFVWKNVIYDPDPNGFLNNMLSWLHIGPQPFITDQSQAMPCLVIVATWAAAGGTMLIYLAALQGIPAQLYEAADIDGASLWGRLLYITLPQIRTVMLIMLLLQIIATMQVFVEPWTLTAGGGPNGATTTVMVAIYNTAFGSTGNQDWNEASALSLLLFLLLGFFSILYYFVVRRFTER